MSRHKRSAKARHLAEAAENRVRVWQEILQMAQAEGGSKFALEIAASFFRLDVELEMKLRAGLLTAEDAVPAANRSNPIHSTLTLVDGEYIRAITGELQHHPDQVAHLIRVHLDCRKRVLSVLHLGHEELIFDWKA